ncbi:MAG: DUF2207 domain-containing protein, partial [Firmicutes bacterium]|nr:DUF2207 domain-containing protein [Bacillota bacterium]
VQADEGWVIESFQAQIDVQPDGTLRIVETILVDFGGLQRHGIYRDIPVVYRYDEERDRRYDLSVDSVTDIRGQSIKYQVSQPGGYKRIRIGDPDRYVTGQQSYRITYRVRDALNAFPDHDELYWNVTGNGWAFPIDRAAAEVRVEGCMRGDIKGYEAYTGPQGARGRDYRAELGPDGAIRYASTRPFGPYEGLTIVAAWRKGIVAAPTVEQRIGWLLRDNRGLLAGLLGLVLVLVYYVWIWSRVGRDPERGVVVPLFAPPEDISPASARFILRMGYDHKVMAAAIISMAVKGYLTIAEGEGGYVLTRKTNDLSLLSPAERQLAVRLFGTGDLCALGKYDPYTAGAAEALAGYLQTKFQGVLYKTNTEYFGLGLVLSFLAAAGSFILAVRDTAGSLPLYAPLLWAALAAVNAVFYRLLKAPMPAGRRLMDKIEGFRMYLEVAEKDRLALLNPPEETPELFEKYLPYALALDAEEGWARRFAGVLARSSVDGGPYHPSWYHGSRWDALHPGGFASSFSSSFAHAIASSSVPPGSASGGGGGGGSGGGGGGGGGGGW